MTVTMHRSIVSRISMVLVGLMVAVSVLFVSGCGAFSSFRRQTNMLYDGVKGSPGACRKVMVALPFENSAPWITADLNAGFAQELKKGIETEGSRVHMLMPDSPEFPNRFREPARLAGGDLDAAALAAAGQASGVNLVLSVHLVGMRHVTEDRGMFWFAEVAHLARVQMEIAIYHTGTAAKLVDRTIFQNIDITEAEGELIDADVMPKALPLQGALSEIAKTMGTTAGNVLKHIPWEGYVSSVEGDRVVLSAGELCGLKKGATLKVYDVQEVTVEETGQRFFSPGNQIGSITVTAVYPDRSEAAVKDGGPIKQGSIVRLN